MNARLQIINRSENLTPNNKFNAEAAGLRLEAESVFDEKLATSAQLYEIDQLLLKQQYTDTEPSHKLRSQMSDAIAKLARFESTLNSEYDKLSLPENNMVHAVLDYVNGELGSETGYISSNDKRKQAKLRELEKDITPKLCQQSLQAFSKQIRNYNKAKSTTEIIEFMMDRYYKDVEMIEEQYQDKLQNYDTQVEEIKRKLQGRYKKDRVVRRVLQLMYVSTRNKTS